MLLRLLRRRLRPYLGLVAAVLALQLVTVGTRASEHTKALFESNEYREYLHFHGFSVEVALDISLGLQAQGHRAGLVFAPQQQPVGAGRDRVDAALAQVPGSTFDAPMNTARVVIQRAPPGPRPS